MDITIKRQKSVNGTTIGEMLIDGEFVCFTLEDEIRPKGVKVPHQTAIPAGTYKIIITMSERFKKRMPLLLCVPLFNGIRIHCGNTIKDTEGCILLGMSVRPDHQWVFESRKAFVIVMQKIEEAIGFNEPVMITIENLG